MSNHKRRIYTTEKKAAILRRHLVEKVPVSYLCHEFGIQPSVFYTWQRQLFDNVESALKDGRKGRRAEASALSGTTEGQGSRVQAGEKERGHR